MATLTVEIDKLRDLPALKEVLDKLGLEFQIDDDNDWGDLSAAEIEGLKAGIADAEAGRVHSHEYVMDQVNKKLSQWNVAND